MNDEEILKKIGSKLKELRLEKNIKQKDLSEKSGLSMFSISQMETGHNTSLLSLVQVLKALDRIDMLEPFMKEHGLGPEQISKYAETQQITKKRVTSPRPYFSDEEGYTQARIAADESEIEWNAKKEK